MSFDSPDASGGRDTLAPLPTLQFGKVSISPAILAPMEGITNSRYRKIAANVGGVGMLCTEFVRICEDPYNTKALKKSVQKVEGIPLSVQLMGNTPETMSEAAKALVDHGADVIDLNIGCPSKMARLKGVGSAMMKDPEKLREVIKAIRPKVPTLTAKMRAGYSNVEQGKDCFRVLLEEGVDLVTIHARRTVDKYNGNADWSLMHEFQSVSDHVGRSIPIIANGDAWCGVEARKKMKKHGYAGVMFGRPALANPWVFQQFLKGDKTLGTSSQMKLELFLAMVDEFEKDLGPKTLGPVKELCVWWLWGIGFRTKAERQTVMRSQSYPELRAALTAKFSVQA